MKESTKSKCHEAVLWMVDNRCGIISASREFNISVGSIHNYIHNELRYSDDELYGTIQNDMKKRNRRGW